MSLHLFESYIKEREGKEMLRSDLGFVIYSIHGEECYIQDVFITKEHRRSGEASRLADKVAAIGKERGCTHLTGTVDPRLPSATDSIKVLLGYGMKLHSSTSDRLVFFKEL